jgi:hypothetical protein
VSLINSSDKYQSIRIDPRWLVGMILTQHELLRSPTQERQIELERMRWANDYVQANVRLFLDESHSTINKEDLASKDQPDDPRASESHLNRLFNLLQVLRRSRQRWDAQEGPLPSDRTITEAEKTLALLPESLMGAKFGLGGEGDLFLSWENADGVAFLTIDDDRFHVLIKQKTGSVVYRDTTPHDQQILVNEILPRMLPFSALSPSAASPANSR